MTTIEDLERQLGRRLRLLVALDHDIIIRHFLASGALDAAMRQFDCTLVLPPVGHKRVSLDPRTLATTPATVRRLAPDEERLAQWRTMFHVDQMRWRPGRHWAAVRGSSEEVLGHRLAWRYRLCGLPLVKTLYDRRLNARLARRPFEALVALMDDVRPDVVLHPSVLDGLYINELAAETERRGIPFVVAMNSWDNPATKRTMVHLPTRLLVWGPQTEEHAMRFARVPRERIVRFGAAQFEIYREPPRLDRAAFCRLHGIDADRMVLLYAGSSKGCDEFADLMRLERAIEAGELQGAAVVYRPHPWGDCGKDGKRIPMHEWHHVVFEHSARAYIEQVRRGDRRIATPDYRHTRDTLACVDAVMSPLSTILLEAALNGKAPLCVVDDADKDNMHLQLVYKMAHYEDFLRYPELLVARGSRELVPAARALLAAARDSSFAGRLRAMTANFVQPFDRPWGERLVDLLANEASLVQRAGSASNRDTADPGFPCGAGNRASLQSGVVMRARGARGKRT